MSSLNYNLFIPDKYLEVIRALFECKGCIFGGAVRDFIRNEIPKDLDVSVYDHQRFYDILDSLGFIVDENNRSTMIKDDIIIEVCELDNEEVRVEINVSPDFDVNTLAWDGDNIFNYWNPDFDITNIISNIKNKSAEKIRPTNKRMEKMRSKGWLILEPSLY